MNTTIPIKRTLPLALAVTGLFFGAHLAVAQEVTEEIVSQPPVEHTDIRNTSTSAGAAGIIESKDTDASTDSDEIATEQATEETVESKDTDESSDGDKVVDELTIEEIVVTGTRLPLEASQFSKQIITLSAEDMDAIGEPELGRTLARLPQMFGGTLSAGAFNGADTLASNGAFNVNGAVSLNLRGVGTTETLVLVNGNRIASGGLFGGASDIAGIPMAAIERIDIILDGASAIYGADAIGGVVNIILKKDYEGVNFELRGGRRTAGGANEYGFNIGGSKAWDSGSISGNFDWQTKDMLYGHEAGVTPSYNVTGTATSLTAPEASLLGNVNTGTEQLTAPASDGMPAAGDFTPGYTFGDEAKYQSIIPEEDRYALNLFAEQALTENLTLSGGIIVSKRDTSYDRGVIALRTKLQKNSKTRPSSALNPWDAITWVDRLYPELGIQQSESTTNTRNLNFMFDWKISEDWSLEWRNNFSRNEIDTLQTNALDRGALTHYLHEFNPWGDVYANNSQAVLDTIIIGDLTNDTLNKDYGSDLILRGSPFTVPAGAVLTSLGVSKRKVELTQEQDALGLNSADLLKSGATIGSNIQDFDGEQDIDSIFGEIHIPLLAHVPGAHQLDISGALRYDSYDSQGSSSYCSGSDMTDCWGGDLAKSKYSDSTYSVGLVWAPVDALRFKFDVSTAFVAPTPLQNFSPTRFFENVWTTNYATGQVWLDNPGISDMFGREPGDVGATSWCDYYYGSSPSCHDQDFSAGYLDGGNPDLDPQNSKSKKLVVEYFVTDGLMLRAAFNNTDYNNKIVTATDLLDLPGAWDALPELVQFADNGDLILVDSRQQNLNREELRSYDLGLNYSLETGLGNFIIDLNWTHQQGFTRWFDNNGIAPSADLVGIKIPENAGMLDVRWSRHNWFASWNSAYRGEFNSIGILEAGSGGNARWTAFDSTLSHNIALGYSFDNGFMRDSTLNMRITNLTDERVETELFLDDIGQGKITGLGVADPRGRMVFLNFRKAF